MLTNSELRRGFRKGCSQYAAATAIGDYELAKFALHCLDATLDVWNERHPR